MTLQECGTHLSAPDAGCCCLPGQSEKKEEGSGFTSWQKADCASALSMERCGLIPTTHQHGLQKRQRAEERDGAASPAMGTEWEQGRGVRGHSPGSQSSPGLKHKTGPDWGVEGSNLTWRKDIPLPACD